MRHRPLASVLVVAALIVAGFPGAYARASDGDGPQVGVPTEGALGIPETVEQIMEREAARPPRLQPRMHPELEGPDRRTLPQDPRSPALPRWPPAPGVAPLTGAPAPLAPQTLGISFTGATLADTFAFPPDTMGAAGPTQFIVAVNGRIRSFNKSTGVADGVLNADPDVFFATVMTPGPNFTSDPRIRYDRLSGRWFVNIIDVPGATPGTVPNRVLLAVSDAASAGVISPGTVWTFFFFQADAANFADYDTLGIDNNALYVGANMFTSALSFAGTNGYVVRKTSVLGAGPIVVTKFANLTGTPAGPGPYTPQGVDNYDPAATEGYFIGVDNATFGTLMLRRVTNPGGTPSLSANIGITVSTTTFPIRVPHLGNTGGTNGNLDALDDRLFAAHIRGGRLWTAHNIQVNSSGVAAGGGGRNGTRWYELQNVISPGVPSVRQSGTVFDSAAANPVSFWIPSVTVSGQGHAALGFSAAGAAARIDAATVGRLSGDALGTTQGTPVLYTASSTAYNPPSDPGGAGGRRWGDYSFTSLDPNDDMTLWTIQEFCNATNSYGVRVVKLIAPPPASLSSCTPVSVPSATTQNVTLTGVSASGSGFYDPGPGFPNRLQASVSGGVTVNTVTYNNPTSITLNVTTTTAGSKDVTVNNPDGQSVVGTGCITVTAGASADLSITKTDGQATAVPGAPITYTIVASNAGPSSATGATVMDTVPAVITGVSWTCLGAGGGTCPANGAGNINHTVNLPAGGSVTYTLTGTVGASATGSLSNTATVTAPGGVTDSNPANNSATDTDTLTPRADLSITKTDGQTTAVSGSPVSYTIVASNAGPSTATGATVTDTVPAAITGASWTCVGAGGGTCAASGPGNINDNVNLPVGGSVTYTLIGTISPAAIGTLSNTATVAAPAGVTDLNLANNSATDTDTLVALTYFTLAPCRVVDTRGGAPIGGPVMQGQETRVLNVAGNCGIPSTAKALAINIAVTQPSVVGNIRLFPAGQPLPTVSSINYSAGQTRTNNAIVTLNASGALAAFIGQAAGTTVHLIIDVDGYFE